MVQLYVDGGNMKTEKVVVVQKGQDENGDLTYHVKKLVNRTSPRIGEVITESQVKTLMGQSSGSRKVTVEIV